MRWVGNIQLPLLGIIGLPLTASLSDLLRPLPAMEIEQAVLQQIQITLQRPEMVIAVWRSAQQQVQRGGGNTSMLDEARAVVAMRQIGEVWAQLFPVEQQRIARLLIERVQLHAQGLDIVWKQDGWQGLNAGFKEPLLVEEAKRPRDEHRAWTGEPL